MISSKIFFYCLLSFVLGIGLASFLFIYSFFLYFATAILLLILIFISKKAKIYFFIFLFLFIGIFYYQFREETIDENHIAFFNDEKVVFQGKVIKEIDERLDKIKITLGNIVIDGKGLSGKVLVNAPLYSDYQYGDALEVECKIEDPGLIEDFDYGNYLSRYGIYSVCYWTKIEIIEKSKQSSIYSNILRFKKKSLNFITTNFPEPQATFLSAILCKSQTS